MDHPPLRTFGRIKARTLKPRQAALVETLLANGIDTVYGLPGLHNDPLFDAFHAASNGRGGLKSQRLKVVHTRHEQTSAYMALGAALATNKPQAFAVVPGPGFLNASAALLSAYAMNAPVIGLIGQIPQGDIDRGFGHLHELRDQIGAFNVVRYITFRTAMATLSALAATLYFGIDTEASASIARKVAQSLLGGLK